MSFEELSPELQAKARACKTKEELMALAESVGAHLSDDELKSIAGGICKKDCPGDGAICWVDTICITKGSCPAKNVCPDLCIDLCQDLLSCIPKYCTNLFDPPYKECTEHVDNG